jgi:hypothetical protein
MQTRLSLAANKLFVAVIVVQGPNELGIHGDILLATDTKRRNRLLPERLEALQFLNENLSVVARL